MVKFNNFNNKGIAIPSVFFESHVFYKFDETMEKFKIVENFHTTMKKKTVNRKPVKVIETQKQVQFGRNDMKVVDNIHGERCFDPNTGAHVFTLVPR